jgi:hypothetical protein
MARLSRHPGDSLPGLRKRNPGYAALVFWMRARWQVGKTDFPSRRNDAEWQV